MLATNGTPYAANSDRIVIFDGNSWTFPICQKSSVGEPLDIIELKMFYTFLLMMAE